MRVIVALESRFSITPDGTVYPYSLNSVNDYAFWGKYLNVFEEVVVFARTNRIEKHIEHVCMSGGARVTFIPVPDFIGPWQYLKVRHKLIALAKQVLKPPDACIIRVPGQLGTLLWYELIKVKRPYGIEVVGDPWDSLGPESVRSILQPIARRKARRELLLQSRFASAASYVTKYSLQKRYPPGCWSTYYSSIELDPKVIVDASVLETRIARVKTKLGSGVPLRICFAGTMAQLYKAPDVLIDAVADCINKGIKLELIMLGDGQYRAQLEKQVQNLRIAEHVKFLGQLPPGQAVYEQFDRSDLYVLPSRQEGLPRSVIEAMARGLPCITSTVGGVPELMEDRYMVTPNDVEALSARIASMASDVGQMEEAARRNVKLAAQYCTDVLRKRRDTFYNKIKEVTLAWSKQ